jgi:tRNA threonylcarbamoyl adenosine modification protein YjeE
VRGACRALGVEQQVTSPTFVIGQIYEAPVTVAHVDLYRLEGLSDEDPALLSDYLRSDTIAFVEWPERGGAGFGDASVARAAIEHAGGDRRAIMLSGEQRVLAAASAWERGS